MVERRALEEAKQQLGEEQLAVVELVNQVSTSFDCSSDQLFLLLVFSWNCSELILTSILTMTLL